MFFSSFQDGKRCFEGFFLPSGQILRRKITFLRIFRALADDPQNPPALSLLPALPFDDSVHSLAAF